MTLGDNLLDDIVAENEITLHSLTHSHRGFDSVVLTLTAQTDIADLYDTPHVTQIILFVAYALIFKAYLFFVACIVHFRYKNTVVKNGRRGNLL